MMNSDKHRSSCPSVPNDFRDGRQRGCDYYRRRGDNNHLSNRWPRDNNHNHYVGPLSYRVCCCRVVSKHCCCHSRFNHGASDKYSRNWCKFGCDPAGRRNKRNRYGCYGSAGHIFRHFCHCKCCNQRCSCCCGQ
jgi:hypothetical protein